MTEFCNRMKELRQAAGLTRPQLAKETGIAPTTFKAYEDGKTTPSLLTAAILCDYFRCSMDYLAGREDYDVQELALEVFGGTHQHIKCIEEMAELAKELCKSEGGIQNRDAIAEEIADVRIMLDQMEILHECREDVRAWKAKKLERLERTCRGEHG